MDTTQIVALLVAERDRLNTAIEALQGAAKRRRGRPPKNPMASLLGSSPVVSAASAPSASGKGKRKQRSAASKRAQGEKMKAYWAAKRKAAK